MDTRAPHRPSSFRTIRLDGAGEQCATVIRKNIPAVRRWGRSAFPISKSRCYRQIRPLCWELETKAGKRSTARAIYANLQALAGRLADCARSYFGCERVARASGL